jgi:prephenate dehydrogenase
MPSTLPSVAILGPGLMGGSLLLDLAALENVSVSIWARRQDSVDALRDAVPGCRASTDLADAVSDAELVVLATPVEVMADLADRLRGLPRFSGSEGVVVTDVGSVKGSVVAEVGTIFAGSSLRFIGSHPMAGSEDAGFSAARKGLYQDAPCVLTPVPGDRQQDIDLVAGFWQALGCQIHLMSPEDHDRRIALISHLPHLVASITVRASLGADAKAAEVAGSGFRDATRIAAGDADLWTGIFRQNRAAVVDALAAFHRQTGEVLALLKDMDDEALRVFLTRAEELRRSVSQGQRPR